MRGGGAMLTSDVVSKCHRYLPRVPVADHRGAAFPSLPRSQGWAAWGSNPEPAD
jgi:hypothetical protein